MSSFIGVTGGSGFVGNAVIRRLLGQGHRVRALTRAASDRQPFEDLDIELAIGDLRDPASLGAFVDGLDGLYHVAADYRLWVRDPKELYDSNVDGTRHLMQAALAAKIPRVVYTSSVATLGLTKDGTPADETTPNTLGDVLGNYKRSKYLAEEAVRALVKSEGLPAVIVNPSTPIGPRDWKPTPTGRMIRDAANGRIPAAVDTGLNIVHVEDVVTGHLLAFERGMIGERYILGGTDMPLKDILNMVARLTGGRGPVAMLPVTPLMPIAWIMEQIARATDGPDPIMTLDSLAMARKRMFFSSAKAMRELGYSYRPAEEAIADALSWFAEQGTAPMPVKQIGNAA